MGTKTINYQLNQWEPEDDFLRADFNEDNAKIEEALTTKVEIVTGIYTGNGEASQTIALGSTPKALFTCTASGQFCDSYDAAWVYGGLALPDYPVTYSSHVAMEIVEGGFQVYLYDDVERIKTNTNGRRYYYLAFK